MNSSSPHPDSYMLQRDRFELLSAYLDGEVTAAERQQVEQWLAHDPVMQTLHTRLLKLRNGFRALPTPPVSQPVEVTVEQVLTRIDQRPRLKLIWGGAAAAAALFVGALSLGLPGSNPFAPQMAKGPTSPAVTQTAPSEPLESDGLLVALDRPVLTIPKAATVQPMQGIAPIETTGKTGQ
jgi:anti-sigma factor RsiW